MDAKNVKLGKKQIIDSIQILRIRKTKKVKTKSKKSKKRYTCKKRKI